MADHYENMLDQLIEGTLDPESFSHRDHVGVAFVALDRFEFFEALYRLADGLRDLATRAGVPEKFNATITFYFMSLIAERRSSAPCGSATDFIEANPDLLESAIIGDVMRGPRMQSDLAKSVPLFPENAA